MIYCDDFYSLFITRKLYRNIRAIYADILDFSSYIYVNFHATEICKKVEAKNVLIYTLV